MDFVFECSRLEHTLLHFLHVSLNIQHEFKVFEQFQNLILCNLNNLYNISKLCIGFADVAAEGSAHAAPITVQESRWQLTGECKYIEIHPNF
jgi:hypothetical protein